MESNEHKNQPEQPDDPSPVEKPADAQETPPVVETDSTTDQQQKEVPAETQESPSAEVAQGEGDEPRAQEDGKEESGKVDESSSSDMKEEYDEDLDDLGWSLERK